MRRKTRVGLITRGGDCQGLNAAIRGVGKSLYQYVDHIEIFGVYDGYRGLIENDYKFMEPNEFPASSPRAAPFLAPAAGRSATCA